MRIILNGKTEKIKEAIAISKMLEERKVKKEHVAVKLNGKIVPRGDYDLVLLKEGDEVDFLYYMGGGY